MSPLFINVNRSSGEAPEGYRFLVLARQLCEKMRFFDKIQQWCKTALFPHFRAMSTTKIARKGPKYAKFAHIGDTVYSKGSDVHCEAQMRRCYGDLWKEKWVHGTIRNIIKKPVNGRNQRYYNVEYINPDNTTKCHELRDIRCRDAPENVADVSPEHPILGLTDVTTPKDANDNTVTISPDLYEQMADMSTIDMTEAQEEDFSDEDEDKAPGDNDLVLSVATSTDPISWFADVDYAMLDANGPVDPLGWQFQGRDGRWMSEDDDRDLKCSPLDYFLAAFPPTALKRILTLTNKSLRKNGGKEIELGELLRFFGVILLITKFDCGRRRELWNTVLTFKYVPSPQFGIRTGMCRNRFEEIWMNLVFSAQPEERPADMSSVTYRWMLVDDFVDDFNRHRRTHFRPSELVSGLPFRLI
jgi:Transposase IS4